MKDAIKQTHPICIASASPWGSNRRCSRNPNFTTLVCTSRRTLRCWQRKKKVLSEWSLNLRIHTIPYHHSNSPLQFTTPIEWSERIDGSLSIKRHPGERGDKEKPRIASTVRRRNCPERSSYRTHQAIEEPEHFLKHTIRRVRSAPVLFWSIFSYQTLKLGSHHCGADADAKHVRAVDTVFGWR